MVFPGNNQPPTPGQPGDPFAPGPSQPPYMPPPQPPMQPGYYPPPPPAKSGSGWKIVIIGCLAFILLGGIATVAGCGYFIKSGGKMMASFMKMAKPEFQKALSPEHSPEQRAEFEETYDFYVGQLEVLGFMSWIEKYGDLMNTLNQANLDGKLTPEETQAWVAGVRAVSGQAPAGGDGDPGSDSGSGDSGAAEGGSEDSGGGDSGGENENH